MPLWLWIVLYLAQLAFWLWLGWWGGAAKLQGTWVEGWFLTRRLAQLGSDPLRLWAWLAVPATTVWFVLGLLDENVRQSLWSIR